MKTKFGLTFKINTLLNPLRLKTRYLKAIENQISNITKIKNENYRTLDKTLFPQKYDKLTSKSLADNSFFVSYILNITFSHSNTFVHIMEPSGRMKLFYSAGSVDFKGRSKRLRREVLKSIYTKFLRRLRFLNRFPIALHLVNVTYLKFYIIKFFKKKFPIRVIKVFSNKPHNGCRKPKPKRKKLRTKQKKRRSNSRRESG